MYASTDFDFVEAVEKKLNANGIRYWRDVHDMTAGRVDRQIERGITLNQTVLLVLSKNSVDSPWVEWEVELARQQGQKLKRDVLCPVALDDSWKTCDWSAPLRNQVKKYHILDFSAWRHAETFRRQWRKLLDGLQLFYGGNKRSDSPITTSND